MKLILKILRRINAEAEPCWQSVPFETDDESETVATALAAICDDGHFLDTAGHAVGVIRWEHSCLQKKCGACAMVIDGRPRLACDAFLREFSRKGTVSIEPLRKFPVVADLIVDRSILYENLKVIKAWMHGDAASTGKAEDRNLAFEASRCLLCGCCLEVCPNFAPGERFFGAASFSIVSRLLLELPEESRKELRKTYMRHIYAGCGKSLACRDVCPAGIDTEKLLSRSNAVALFRR